MSNSENLSMFYLKDASALSTRIWITQGVIPSSKWPDADVVFVLEPSPLDIPVVAEISKESEQCRKLVLVTGKIRREGAKDVSDPLSEFFALPVDTLNDVLKHLLDRDAPVFFLSFQKRRPWYLRWLPEVERDSFPVDGKHFTYYFDEYTQYEGSFEFDDAYRRTSLKECTFAQSVNHFLHILEGLLFTNIPDPATKRCLFQSVFPFYTGKQGITPDIHFEWNGTPEPIRTAIIGDEIKKHTGEYAMAVSCLSEIAAAFTHRGRHDLYLRLMGDLVGSSDGKITVGAFSENQIDALRRDHPFLYLHVLYRVSNQYIIAKLDEVEDSFANSEIIAAAEDLLHRLVTRESDLHFVKRRYELTALSGTLGQLKTTAARAHNNRKLLLEAKEDTARAVQHARPDDLSRDINYWINAVLTDWVLFPEQSPKDPAVFEEEYEKVVTYLDGHLRQETKPNNYYDLMVAHLSVAVEAECLKRARILDLVKERSAGPERLNEIFRSPDYDERRMDAYAICLAAGYAALLAPDAHWNLDSLDIPMQKAQRFFFDVHSTHQGREGLILRIIALKHAACRLFYLRDLGKMEEVSSEATIYMDHLDALGLKLGSQDKLESFFERAKENPDSMRLRDVLRTVILLPY